MGKGMKARPYRVQPKYELTRKELEEIKNEVIMKVMLLAATAYADEYLIEEDHYLPDTDEKILEFWERMSRYSEAEGDGLISMNYVTKVLRNNMNLDVHWR